MSDTPSVRGARILVVEDDLALRGLLARGLEEEGFDVLTATTGAEAMARSSGTSLDGIIIDIGLPDSDGRDVCQALRAVGVLAPVLFLTARDALTDRLSGFGAGGDDYVTKPFHITEVAVRMRALLRRSGIDTAPDAVGLRMNPTTYEIEAGGRTAALTPTEFRLLAALAGRQGSAVARRELVRAAWPEGAIVHDNTLDVYVARLRRKLLGMPEAPTIATMRGVGYRLS